METPPHIESGFPERAILAAPHFQGRIQISINLAMTSSFDNQMIKIQPFVGYILEQRDPFFTRLTQPPLFLQILHLPLILILGCLVAKGDGGILHVL